MTKEINLSRMEVSAGFWDTFSSCLACLPFYWPIGEALSELITTFTAKSFKDLAKPCRISPNP